MYDIKVKFQNAQDRTGVNMFIYFEGRGKNSVLKDLKTMEFEEVEYGAVVDPIYLPPDVFAGIKEAIFRDFHSPNATFNEGKLDATERHLKDMRILLKLK